MSKHTKGPWKASIANVKSEIHIYQREHGTVVANVNYLANDMEAREARSNANLIAAAPEMLDALHSALNLLHMSIVRFWNCDGEYNPAKEVQILKKIIAKAEGREV